MLTCFSAAARSFRPPIALRQTICHDIVNGAYRRLSWSSECGREASTDAPMMMGVGFVLAAQPVPMDKFKKRLQMSHRSTTALQHVKVSHSSAFEPPVVVLSPKQLSDGTGVTKLFSELLLGKHTEMHVILPEDSIQRLSHVMQLVSPVHGKNQSLLALDGSNEDGAALATTAHSLPSSTVVAELATEGFAFTSDVDGTVRLKRARHDGQTALAAANNHVHALTTPSRTNHQPHALLSKSVLDAAREGNVDALRAALIAPSQQELDASTSTANTNDKGTALHLFVASYNSRIDDAACIAGIDLLLQHGADVNALASNGSTALHWAAGAGNVAAVKHLLSNGADALVRTYTWREQVFGKGSGQLALHWAAESNHTDIVALLTQHCLVSASMVDERSATPLDVARKELAFDSMDVLQRQAARKLSVLHLRVMASRIQVLTKPNGVP